MCDGNCCSSYSKWAKIMAGVYLLFTFYRIVTLIVFQCNLRVYVVSFLFLLPCLLLNKITLMQVMLVRLHRASFLKMALSFQ